MNANADPDERPLTGDADPEPSGGDASFDAWAADLSPEALPVDIFDDLETPDEAADQAADRASDADLPDTGPRAREVRFLAELAKLSAERAKLESRYFERSSTEQAEAEQAAAQAKQDLAAWLETEARAVVEAHSTARTAAKEKYERDISAAEAEYAKLQEKVNADFAPHRAETQRLLDVARHEADVQYDSQKSAAPRKLEEFERQLEAWKVRIAGDRDQAFKLLKKWGQPAPTISADTASPVTTTGDLATRMQARVDFVAQQLAELSNSSSPKPAISWALRIFWVLLIVAGAAAAWLLGPGPIVAAAIMGAGLVLGILGQIMLVSMARSQVKEIYPPICAAAREVEQMVQGAMEKAREQTAAAQTKLIERRELAQGKADAKHQARVAQIDAKRDERLRAPTQAYEKRLGQVTSRRDRDLKQAEEARTTREAERRRKQQSGAGDLQTERTRQIEQIQAHRSAEWQALVDLWQSGLTRLQAMADEIRTSGGEPGGGDWLNAWNHWEGKSWPPAREVPPAIRFGEFRVRMDQIPDGVPQSADLAKLTPAGFSLPATAPFPDRPSILFKARGNGRAMAIEAIQALMLRLLVTLPPSKLRFTIFDPVGLGENFAAFMHLADFNEALVSNRIWTEAKHIEERLADLSEHMENVIQKYLRNEFQSIEEYNRDAGEIAEPFRYLVIANYPAAFSEAAQRRLMSIAASGARCGVYTLIMADTQVPLPTGFALRDIEQHGTTLQWNHGRFVWRDRKFGMYDLKLDPPPPPGQVTEMLQVAGRYANEAGKVEVPFEAIAPPIEEQWTTSAAKGVDVPLGRAGASRLQSLKLGKGTSQHVIIGGKTGSGKSTLLHALITNAALRYSPDEVELYLIDFKQGVEFKTYVTHKLPHARIVAIESDREFGVSVLGRLDNEIKVRADRFRDLGVQDLNGYRQADPVNPLPRVLMIVDEFQEFFTEDDKIAQDAALLLDRLVRQGRAFGIHVLLGSQTLAGSTLGRSTLGQMAVRIALQCNESDAHLILSDENSAARLLTRPGEAIYNDSNGMIEGNHPFQVVWLPDERREIFLDRVNAMVDARSYPTKPQVVFEGNVPADPANNKGLAAVLAAGRPARVPDAAVVWLGDAVAIKDPTAIAFRAQSGSNLLIVGQNEEAALGIMSAALISLAAQHPASETLGVKFYIFDGSAPGSPQAAALAQLPGITSDMVRLVPARELPAAVNEVAVELDRRQKAGSPEVAPIYIMIYGVQKLRDLRKPEDDFGFSRSSENQPPNPGKQFATVVREGPAWGIHTIVWCDGVNNLNRTWDRQGLRELEMRIVFQMSSNDSSTLIDNPAAGKLGKNRALFHSEEQGILEKFRPYRWPGDDWLATVRDRLGGRGDTSGAPDEQNGIATTSPTPGESPAEAPSPDASSAEAPAPEVSARTPLGPTGHLESATNGDSPAANKPSDMASESSRAPESLE